jgi:hypothetical protein
MIKLKVIYCNLKRIIRWIPVLWNDRDWDYSHIYRILRFKLLTVRENQIEFQQWVSSNLEDNSKIIESGEIRINRQLTVCIKLLERLIEDGYGLEEYRKHEEKWGKHIYQNDGLMGKREKVTTPELEAQEHTEVAKIFQDEDNARSADIKAFFKIFEKYHERWWT